MGNKTQQDAYVDDVDDTCPLCVEEFDLSDRNFRPCPCGYQVCQFCYNNIKSNMNGLCPACRRPYDDKTIEWKVVSPEEFKADVAAQARRKAAARQKEAERKQVETLNKKHLAGLRVLQKNLVYVVGMDISGDEHALETLRGPNHFGQYGEIIKIVASKAKEGYAGHQSTGIYVTFARKEDAATCIAAVDGTPHDDRVLRAQYGTTKYCSSFLRNERCTNRNCMFLHETGDDNDSFSRQDLSSFNAASSQRSAPPGAAAPTAKVTYQNPTQMASPAPTPASVAQTIKAEAMSRSDSGGDGPALPTTATWAKNPQIEQSRRSSQAPSRATPSPKPISAKLVLPRPDSRAGKSNSEAKGKNKKVITADSQAHSEPDSPTTSNDAKVLWRNMVKSLAESDLRWKFDRNAFDPTMMSIADNHPPMFSLNEGVLQIMRRKEREDQATEQPADSVPTSAPEDDGQFGSGSLQLGGEPEHGEDFLNQRNNHGQTAFTAFNEPTSFDRQSTVANEFANLTLGGRSLTPQQQRNISLLRSGTISQESGTDQIRGPTTNQHHSQLSNPFQVQNQQLNNLARHGRQTSRFTFSADPSIASGSIKPSANAQMMNQMAQNAQKGFNNTQPGMQSAFYSGIQGPPPGLKASGTPPISGGGMFGQGHGFASAMGGSSGFGSNLGKGNDENTRDLLRNRTGGDAGKVDISDPSILQARMQHPSSTAQGPYGGNQSQDDTNFEALNRGAPQLPQIASLKGLSRSSTPSRPPGFGLLEFPLLTPPQKPVFTASLKTVTPAIPMIPRPETPKANTAVSVSNAANLKEIAAASLDGNSKNPAPDLHFDGSNTGTPESSSIVAEKVPSKSSGRERSAVSDSSISREPSTVATLENQSLTPTPVAFQDLEKVVSPSLVEPLEAVDKSSGTAASVSRKTISSPSPVVVRQPRTLRLVTTLKVEDSTSISTEPESARISNETSLAKPDAHHSGYNSTKQPSTPVNELISETVSLTSASASRPGTPGLMSRFHTGPTITKSKNQIKKERQARAKQLEELKSEELSTADEPVQAPVIGRKKKAKKAALSKPRTAPKLESRYAAHAVDDLATRGDIRDAAIDEQIDAEPVNAEIPTVEEGSFGRDEPSELIQPLAKPILAVGSILADLKDEGILTAADLDYYLNPVGLNTRHDINMSKIFKYEANMELDEEEKDILDCGDSIAKQLNPDEWAVILPDRSVLRYFTKEEACHYVDLKLELDQKSVDTFNGTDFPTEAWSNFTSNDVWAGLQVAPPVDGNHRHGPYSIFDTPEPLIEEFTTTLLRPHVKDVSYGAMYPPRTQAENEEIEARMAMYTLEEAEQTVKASEELLIGARKETEQLEKKLNALVKKNRKILKDWQ